jgi:hypothetical protein
VSDPAAAISEPGEDESTFIGSTNDLAVDAPTSRLDRILQWIPRILSSKPHVMILMGLGVYLILLPLFGVHVSSNAELIGGNYTNVTGDVGACIAAGGTLHLVNQSRKRRRMDEERLRLARESHRLLHYIYGEAAHQLGHLTVAAPPGPGRPASGPQGQAGGGPGAT